MGPVRRAASGSAVLSLFFIRNASRMLWIRRPQPLFSQGWRADRRPSCCTSEYLADWSAIGKPAVLGIWRDIAGTATQRRRRRRGFPQTERLSPDDPTLD